MEIRVTPNVVTSNALLNLRKETDTLANLQEQASTGLKLVRPSDNPADMVTVMANKAQDLRLSSYLTNIQGARSTLNLSVSSLQEVTSILAQAKRIGIEGSNAVNDSASFETLAQEVDALVNRLVDAANTKNAGHYLFGGTATQAPPFRVAADGSIVYQGAWERGNALVSPGQTVDVNYPGDQVFQGRHRGVTLFTGRTGAAAGTGTDSATGQGNLLVSHTSTTFQAGSGVQAGSSSVAGDTILGPAGANYLTINDTSGTGAAGTVSLNGGSTIAFSNTATNLKVTGPAGEVIYLDTTAITPGFNGAVNVTAAGTLSVDNGASQVPINFSSNQVVTNGATGLVTNVNSINIRQTGTERLDYPGSFDVFQALAAIRNDLRDPQLTDAQRAQSLSQRLGELDRVRTSVLDVVGEQSATLSNLDSLESRHQNMQLEIKQWTSDLESADVSQVVVNLQNQENLLKLTLGSAARINDLSLLDFLR